MGVRLTLQQTDRRERRGIMAALDAAHCLVWFDHDGYLIDANANTQNLLNCNYARLTNWSFRDLTGGRAGSDTYYQNHWARILAGDITSEERDVMTGDGSTLWCTLTHAPILAANGAVKLVFTLVVDLSPWNRNPKEGLRRIY